MDRQDLSRIWRDERGIALPLSLMVLVLLSSVTIAFVAMSATEPVISANLRSSDQALALAEAGVEQAIWALTNPTAPGVPALTVGGVPAPADLPAAVPAPYGGATLIAFGAGAYTISLSGPGPGAVDPNDRNVTTVGYVVRNGAAVPASPDLLTQADRAGQRSVKATLAYIGPPNTPGALTVAGSVQLQGDTGISGAENSAGHANACPQQAGVTIRDKSTLADGTVVNNTISAGGSASATGTPPQQVVDTAAFQKYLWGDAQLSALRTYAQTHPGQATYIKPTSHDQFNLNVTNGLIFVDTVNGAAIGTPPDPNKLANVKISGANASGWIVVMGSIEIDGNVNYNGFIYAVNDISYRGTGTGGIYGAMMSANVIDTVSTVVDTDTSGQSKIYYDCDKVKNGGGGFTPPTGYFLKGGTWQEVSN